MKDGLAKDDILEMRVNFAFLALVYYYYRKCNEQFDTDVNFSIVLGSEA